MKTDKQFDVSAYSINEYVGKINEGTFDCGVQIINNFIHHDAIKFGLSNQASTTIVVDNSNDKILGFYTLHAGILSSQNGIDNFSIPNSNISAYDGMYASPEIETHPVINLAYIALNKKYQGNREYRYGTQLLRHLYKTLVFDFKDRLGFVALTVTALHRATDFYTDNQFEYLLNSPDSELLKEYEMFLRYETIKESLME